MARKDGESVLRKVVTLSDVAALTVQSERSIQRLVKSGVIRLAKDRQRRQLKGRFVLGDCIPRICEHLRDQMTAADPNAAAYAEARARRMQCVAEVAELELKQKKRELHHARDVEFVLSLMIRNARDRLRAIPSRTMFMVQGKAPPEINRLIAGEIDTPLNELADETDLSAKFRRETDAYASLYSGQTCDQRLYCNSINETRPPERRMDKKVVSEVCVAGDVQFKWASVDKVPIHDEAHATVVPRRHDANPELFFRIQVCFVVWLQLRLPSLGFILREMQLQAR